MKAHRDRKRCRMHLSDEVRFTSLLLMITQKTGDVKFIFNSSNVDNPPPKYLHIHSPKRHLTTPLRYAILISEIQRPIYGDSG